MRGSIRCLVLGALAVATFRLTGLWPHGPSLPRGDGAPWWGALSFALAAVVDGDLDG